VLPEHLDERLRAPHRRPQLRPVGVGIDADHQQMIFPPTLRLHWNLSWQGTQSHRVPHRLDRRVFHGLFKIGTDARN
jgi:hypothetical protein